MSDSIDILMGGREVEVSLVDGTTRKVFVKQLGWAEVSQVLPVWGDDVGRARMYLKIEDDKQAFKLLQDLTPQSGIDILEVGDQLNQQALLDYVESARKKLDSPLGKALAELGKGAIDQMSSVKANGSLT